MTELDSLERLLAQLFRRRRALTRDPEVVALAAEWIVGNERLSPVEQLEIYRQQFWLRHTTALLEDFPGVSGILGQGDWERLAEEYLEAHPPSTQDLRDIGERLPDFIAHHAGWAPHRHLLTDMARLEWAYVAVFDAADEPRLPPEKLGRLGEGQWLTLRLQLSAALRLLRVDYPVVELRKRLRKATSERIPIPDSDCQRLLIHRSALDIRVEPLEEAPFRLLEALAAGETLRSACEAALRSGESAAELVSTRLGAWFEDWVRRGVIVDVTP